MSARQSKRARAIARRPDVVAWVADLSRVLQAAPPDVWLYAASCELELMACGEDGRCVMTRGGGVEPGERVATPDRGERGVHVDGGDW